MFEKDVMTSVLIPSGFLRKHLINDMGKIVGADVVMKQPVITTQRPQELRIAIAYIDQKTGCDYRKPNIKWMGLL